MHIRKQITAGVLSALFIGGALAIAPAAQAAPAIAHTSVSPATVYACTVNIVNGIKEAGYYSGNTVTPATNQVTSSGKEAQCILKVMGYPVGNVDGEFGPNSQAAMKDFQRDVNSAEGKTVLSVDGFPGPKSWPYLRTVW